MKTRKMKCSDYGISRTEMTRLKKYCKNYTDDESDELLKDAARAANASIANRLYDSIRNGKSYEKLDRESYMPISKVDFYGYRRKCLYTFKNLLLFCGKWK